MNDQSDWQLMFQVLCCDLFQFLFAYAQTEYSLKMGEIWSFDESIK